MALDYASEPFAFGGAGNINILPDFEQIDTNTATELKAGKLFRRDAKFAQSIPGYRIEGKLGSGAMGIVYKAFQKSMNRYVAIKILKPDVAHQPAFAERFLREAHASAKVSHANIMSGLDAGEANGMKYFVMEYLEGETLRSRLKRDGRLTEEQALPLAVQMAGALEAAEKNPAIPTITNAPGWATIPGIHI